VASVRRIEPDGRPATLTEVRETVAELLDAYQDDPTTTGALGVVAALLASVECHCEPPAVGPAVVLPLTTPSSTSQGT
jgi:hypothetical protein